MNFIGWLISEGVDPNHPALRANQMEIVDSVSAGEYEMYLMKTSHPLFPSDMRYQLAVQRADLDFLDPSHQMGGASLKDAIGGLSALKSFGKTLKGWLTSYGPISVSSLNDEKTKKWAMGLEWMGFKLSWRSLGLPGGGEKEYFVILPK